MGEKQGDRRIRVRDLHLGPVQIYGGLPVGAGVVEEPEGVVRSRSLILVRVDPVPECASGAEEISARSGVQALECES